MYKQAIINNLIKKALFSKEELLGTAAGLGTGVMTSGIWPNSKPLTRGLGAGALGAGAGLALANDLGLSLKNKLLATALGGGINGLLNSYDQYAANYNDDKRPGEEELPYGFAPILNAALGVYTGHRAGAFLRSLKDKATK